jgi:hypothetical protein
LGIDALGEIATIGIIHHDRELAVVVVKVLEDPDDLRVPAQLLQDLRWRPRGARVPERG